MTGLSYSTFTGTLAIDAVSMNCPAWDVPDLRPLWVQQAIRGQDRLLPGVTGVIAYRRRRTVTQVSLGIVIVGTADRLGASPGCDPGDVIEQLQENIDYLRANVVDPTNTGNGTRSGVLGMPDGSTRNAYVHVLGLNIVDWRPQGCAGTLDLSIPSGMFV